jgi:hypothetical protein
MANQMIALQTRGVQLPDPAKATAQYASMMNMAQQNETAKRQAAQAQQAMDINAAQEARAVDLQGPNLKKAGYEALTAQMKMLSDFSKLSIEGLRQAQGPEDAIKIGDYIKSNFNDPRLQAEVDRTVAKLTANPANFEPARQQLLFQSMESDKQLEQQIADLTTGAETYQVSSPKYAGAPGGMKATEIPGTRVTAPQGITYVKGDDGSVYGMPTKTGGGFATPTPAASSGGGSPVANALKTNPGALKDGAFAKSQRGYAGASGGFATFKTPEDGIAAQENLLRGSYVNKGFNTIDKIINRYAPPGKENSAASVKNYKDYVARQSGVDINKPISAAQIPAVAKAMREFETGNKSGGGAGAPTPVIAGSGAQAKPSTEGERRFGTVSKNMTSSMKEATAALLESADAAAPGGVEYAASLIPFYGDEARKFAQSGPRQRFEGALLALLDGVTYINTGAGTSATQEVNYKNTYVPTYQDMPKTRKAKLDRAIRFIENSKDAAGVMWTPEINRELENLKAVVAKIDFGGGAAPKAGPRTSTKRQSLENIFGG